MTDNTLRGIGIFQLEITHLISIGKKENIKEIEKHFELNDLVEYLYSKYRSYFSNPFDGSICNNNAINAYFEQYAGYIEGNEDRKYGIENDDDGLLLIIALIAEIIKEIECRN